MPDLALTYLAVDKPTPRAEVKIKQLPVYQGYDGDDVRERIVGIDRDDPHGEVLIIETTSIGWLALIAVKKAWYAWQHVVHLLSYRAWIRNDRGWCCNERHDRFWRPYLAQNVLRDLLNKLIW